MQKILIDAAYKIVLYGPAASLLVDTVTVMLAYCYSGMKWTRLPKTVTLLEQFRTGKVLANTIVLTVIALCWHYLAKIAYISYVYVTLLLIVSLVTYLWRSA